MPSIFLVGFMGSGKSTVAKELATVMNLAIVDLDALIAAREKSTIPELFDQRGEAGFRRAETAALETVVAQNGLVVALGGGTFCLAGNRRLIEQADGISVYLDVPWSVIEDRLLENDPDRPVFGKHADAKRLFEIRRSDYERADFKLGLEGNESPADIASMIRSEMIRSKLVRSNRSHLSEARCVI